MTIDDFLKYVLPDVPGCPRMLATQAVLDSAKEFFSETSVWNELQDPIPLRANVNEYDLDAPSGARCINVRAVYLRSGELAAVTMRQLAERLPNWQTAEGSVPAMYTRAMDYTTLRVFPIPTDPGEEEMTVHAVYTLKDTATQLPDEIVTRYQEALAAGAKSRLQRTGKDNPWYDLQASAINRDIYESGKSRARVEVVRSRSAVHLTVPPRAFG